MQTLRSLDDLARLDRPLHLAFGVFDGVHIGHQAVIQRAANAAKRVGGLSGLVTFHPHPIRVISPDRAPKALLANIDHKAAIIEKLGLDLFIPLHFDSTLAALSATGFLEHLCAAPVATIAVGEDWRFGHRRIGDTTLLRSLVETLGYQLEAVAPVMFKGDRISSTRIRQAIHDGNLTEASSMLGRPYSIRGTVIQGRKLGRTIQFPTANLAVEGLQLPPDGVWVVETETHSGTFGGVANLGIRPTVDGESRTLETHLFDFSGNLYDTPIDVRFLQHLRPERKFPSLPALKTQIALDATSARSLLERREHENCGCCQD